MEITVFLNDLKTIEKVPSKFGNGAHVFVSKKFIGKTAKIISGNSKLVNEKELNVDFFKTEILERKVKEFGTGAHLIIPKEYCGKKIKIIIGGKNE
jgi:putative transposon-encoded protein